MVMRWMIGLWVAGILLGLLAGLAFRQFAYNRPDAGEQGAVNPEYAAAISTARTGVGGAVAALPSVTLDPTSSTSPSSDPASNSVTATPLQPPAPPVSLAGTGTTVTDAVTIGQGLAVVTSRHQGGGRFQVTLFDNDGKQLSRPVIGSGPWQGSGSVVIPEDGLFLFEVIADGDWTIEVTHPIPDPTSSFQIPYTQTGSGFQTLYFLTASSGTYRLTATCDADSLRVTAVNLDGSYRRTLLETSCPFDGTVAFPIPSQPSDSFFVVDVATQGNWTVMIE